MDYVFIEGLKVNGKHGVAESERHIEQEFELWLKMWFDCKKAGMSDDLRFALNYVPIHQMIVDVIKNESFYLIEKLGEVICTNILQNKQITKVELKIKKTAIWPDCIPGVVIIRDNQM